MRDVWAWANAPKGRSLLTDPELASMLEQAQWDLFWVPADWLCVDRPELGYVVSRRSGEYLTTAHRVRGSTSEYPALVAEVAAAHPGPSRILITDTFDAAPLKQAMAAGGYSPSTLHLACVRDNRPPEESRHETHQVRDRQGLDQFNEVLRRCFGVERQYSDKELERVITQVQGSDSRILRFLSYETGKPVAAAAMTLHSELGCSYLWGGCTVEAARGGGHYRGLISKRLAVGHTRGIKYAAIYAREESSAPIVTRLGFRTVGTMRYWTRP